MVPVVETHTKGITAATRMPSRFPLLIGVRSRKSICNVPLRVFTVTTKWANVMNAFQQYRVLQLVTNGAGVVLVTGLNYGDGRNLHGCKQ